jgi:hypothetical protein
LCCSGRLLCSLCPSWLPVSSPAGAPAWSSSAWTSSSSPATSYPAWPTTGEPRRAHANMPPRNQGQKSELPRYPRTNDLRLFLVGPV